MNFETYIVLEKGTQLRRLKAGDGTYAYTVSGQAYFPVGKVIPVISLDDSTCIGIANVEVVTIRMDSSTVYFKMIDSHNYSQIFNAWMLQTGSNDVSNDGAHFGIPTGQHNFRDQRGYYVEEDDDGFSSGDIDRILRGLR